MDVNQKNNLAELRSLLISLVSVGTISIIVLAIAFRVFWWFEVEPILQIKPSSEVLEIKDYFQLRNQAITSTTEPLKVLVTLFGGIAILVNVYFAARRTMALEKNAIAATENAFATARNVEVAEKGQVVERFTKAVEQLGSEELSIRLGGIYALKAIANEYSERYGETVLEIICAFIREQPSLNTYLQKDNLEAQQEHVSKKLRPDIQIALNVISQLNGEGKAQEINLSNADIPKANFCSANLKNIDFHKANLQEAELYEAKLQKADFYGARLERAKLDRAELDGAKLREAHLEGANLFKASLEKANLSGAFLISATLVDATLQKADLHTANLERANLTRANLSEAKLNEANLQRANLSMAVLTNAELYVADLKNANLLNANLEGAVLRRADFEGTNIWSANLKGADLTQAKNLSQEQINEATGNSKTILPNYLTMPESWKQPEQAEQTSTVSNKPEMPQPGLHPGAIWISDDFDEPLPEEFWTNAS